MNKVVKKQWIKALKSGDYKQTTGELKRSNIDHSRSFCCLGVLCDISGISTWEADNRYLEAKGILPNKVKEWAGMANDAGGFSYDNPSLIELNDSGSTFEEIADIIEKNYKEL